jgi:Domain of unknown function (DUF4249)
MHRLLSTFFFGLLLSAFLGACEPDPIDISLPAAEPRLVLASGLSSVRDTLAGFPFADSALVVTVSRTMGALSGASGGLTDSALIFDHLATHARVVLLGNGRADTLRPLESGAYYLPQPPLRTQTPYTLQVYDSTTQLTCQAVAYYLPRMKFDYLRPVVHRTPADTTVTLDYQLTDRPGRSFYLVQYNPLSSSLAPAKPDVQDVNSLFATLQNEQRLRLLTDNDFQAGRYTAHERLAVGARDTVLVGVAQISEEYYRFLQAYQKSGKLFNQITGEPIRYPTNVENGYGFFGLHTQGGQLLFLDLY